MPTKDTKTIALHSPELVRRLSRSTLSRGQAAKRDLMRYHALLQEHQPAVHEHVALHLIDYLSANRAILQWTEIPEDDWSYLVAKLEKTYTQASATAFAALNLLGPLQRCALIDAADRAIAVRDANPARNPFDILWHEFNLIGSEG